MRAPWILMRPILGEMYRLGGSHAQQDVLERLFLDSAVKANRSDDVRLMLARVTARHSCSARTPNWICRSGTSTCALRQFAG